MRPSEAPVDPNTEATDPEAAPEAAAVDTEAISAFSLRLHPLSYAQPFQWLQAGMRDFLRQPVIGAFYGCLFMAMGWLLLTVYRHAPAYLLALSAGFLLMGPFLGMGLYQVSMRLQRGERPDLGDSLTAWDSHMGQMAIFGGVLLILEMIWARASLIVFAVSFDGMPDLGGSIEKFLDPENLGFVIAYLGVGALFAGLIFAISVISIPMMLDKQVDAITAALTSLRLVLTQTGVMLLWGALITLLVIVAMLPGFAGLLVIGPVLGHASWHAYRASVAD
ncbi:DUF2189 domain-containing protein [Paucibacter sp. APW11]|uniref:DUF2189 domain-containing protein n=1 Tax=Roseateles aquae TaxID=3077235 RepID=A0ABU3P6G1_9BURK|nr:DUF2189 domain-containing protein [Paucibacter sp. APW11]MDT8998149.1 DUF2189 domain-containing protein [Paucibacter sp. APW11]